MKLAKNTLSLAASSLLPIILTIATVPLYIQFAGAERYGALAIAWAFLGYFGNLDFGVGRAITQRISVLGDDDAGVASSVVSALASALLFSLLNALLVLLAARFFFLDVFKIDSALRPELARSIWALALCNPLVSISGALSGALMGREKFILVSSTNFLASALMQVLPLAVAIGMGPDLEWMIVASLVARGSALLVLGIAVWREFLRSQPLAPSWDAFGALTRFGAWVMVSAVVGPLMIIADRFVIGAMLGAAAVTAYTIAFQMAYRTVVLPAALSAVLFPRFASDDDQQSQRRSGEFSLITGQLFAGIMIGLICLSGPLLELWLGSKLDPRSIAVAQIAFVGVWFNAVAQIPFAYIQARGDTRFTGLLHLAELPIYVVLLVGLALAFGLPGMAAAFAARCALDCIILLVRARTIDRSIALGLSTQMALILAAAWVAHDRVDWLLCLIAGIGLGLASVGLSLLHMPDIFRQRVLSLPLFRAIGTRATRVP